MTSTVSLARAWHLYHDKSTASFGKNCLLARRLVERGVRFVQLYHGAGSKWDSHSAIEKNHSKLCESSDKPVAGLLADLKQRGLLDMALRCGWQAAASRGARQSARRMRLA